MNRGRTLRELQNEVREIVGETLPTTVTAPWGQHWHKVTSYPFHGLKTPPDMRRLAMRAWTSAEDMEVLVDQLLEQGILRGIESCLDHEFDRDTGLYLLERRARAWTLGLYTDALELRVTGPLRALHFCVARQITGSHPDWNAYDPYEPVDFAVKDQYLYPRLLRAP